jgi:hypothetical protein
MNNERNANRNMEGSLCDIRDTDSLTAIQVKWSR